MIVVAGIGDQRFGQRNALSRTAEVYPRDIFRRGPGNAAKRAAGRDGLIFPAHPAKPQLGAPLVIWRVLRIHKGGADWTVSAHGPEPERCATRIRGCGTEAACD